MFVIDEDKCCVTNVLLQIELNKDDFQLPPGWRWDTDWYISPELR